MDPLLEFVFRQRNLLAALPLVPAFLVTASEWENDVGVWGLALALTLGGIALRNWSNRHCNFNRRETNKLATTGPYAWSRNPLYIGNVLVLLGATVASELIWLLPVTLLWSLAVYSLVIRREERRMRARYGELYATWSARVPRWLSLPDLRALGGPHLHVVRKDLAIVLVLVPFVLKELKVFALWD